MSQNAESDYDESAPKNGILSRMTRWLQKDEYEEEEEEVSDPRPAADPPVTRASGGAFNPPVGASHRFASSGLGCHTSLSVVRYTRLTTLGELQTA